MVVVFFAVIGIPFLVAAVVGAERKLWRGRRAHRARLAA
jgi:hypothetical protein